MPSTTTRIAKNTLMLYFRQILIMLVSLYTVRVVLEALGTEDYGIYNVVAGVVVLFTFLNTAMTNATLRFLNFALGQGNTEQARNVYSASIIIHILIAVLIVVLAQTVGLWFFHAWLNIPPERQVAALVAYQFSVGVTVISTLQIPYRATIIAHEKMSFFAILGFAEAALRLGVAFLLPVILFDKLILYAFLVSITGIIVLLMLKLYCNRTFETAHFRYCKDKQLLRQLLSFSGWSIFGGVANLGREQGTHILINIFHGVTMNAAMGIASHVNIAVYQFTASFQTAFNPQIVKSYSAQNYDYFMQLIFRTSKVSFCLLLLFVLPFYINADFVLQIWLHNVVPEYTAVFTQLIMLSSLLVALMGPLLISIQATGDIKSYQLIAGCFIFINLPLSLLFLWLGFAPTWVLIIRVVLNIITFVWLVFFLAGRINLPLKNFFYKVIAPVIVIAVISVSIAVFSHGFFADGWSKLIISCVVSTLSIGCLMYGIGLSAEERLVFRNWIRGKLTMVHRRNGGK